MNVPEWLVNFFAGLGILETALLVIGGIVIGLAIRHADQEEE